MISDYVMTQHHCTQDSVSAEQSVGMGAYTMDSHNVQRYINEDGIVKNEGDVEVGAERQVEIWYTGVQQKLLKLCELRQHTRTSLQLGISLFDYWA